MGWQGELILGIELNDNSRVPLQLLITYNILTQGLPTKDKEGAEVTKSKRKKLEKEMGQQGKLHQEYLDWIASGNSL